MVQYIPSRGTFSLPHIYSQGVSVCLDVFSKESATKFFFFIEAQVQSRKHALRYQIPTQHSAHSTCWKGEASLYSSSPTLTRHNLQLKMEKYISENCPSAEKTTTVWRNAGRSTTSSGIPLQWFLSLACALSEQFVILGDDEE